MDDITAGVSTIALDSKENALGDIVRDYITDIAALKYRTDRSDEKKDVTETFHVFKQRICRCLTKLCPDRKSVV